MPFTSRLLRAIPLVIFCWLFIDLWLVVVYSKLSKVIVTPIFAELIRSCGSFFRKQTLVNDGIDWRFNSPGTPHFQPFQPLSDDPTDLALLTPGHFLIGSTSA